LGTIGTGPSFGRGSSSSRKGAEDTGRIGFGKYANFGALGTGESTVLGALEGTFGTSASGIEFIAD